MRGNKIMLYENYKKKVKQNMKFKINFTKAENKNIDNIKDYKIIQY